VLTAGHCTNNFPGSPYTGIRTDRKDVLDFVKKYLP
jgi:hypothetical protein